MNETFNYLRANGIYNLEDLESRVNVLFPVRGEQDVFTFLEMQSLMNITGLYFFFSASPWMYRDIFLCRRMRLMMGWNTCWKKGSCSLLFSM